MMGYSLKLKPIRLSLDELKDMTQIMSVGNTALKECAAMMQMNNRNFRMALFRDNLVMTPEQKKKVDAAKPLILAVKNKCEDKLQRAFFKWVTKRARIISAQVNDAHHVFEDLQSEGMWAVLDATYSYTDTNIKIYSFIKKVVNRRMFLAYNNMNPFCPLTNEALRLRRMFEWQKNSYNKSISDQQVIDDMNLSPRQQKVLIRSMTHIVNQRQIEFGNGKCNNDYDDSELDCVNDYTGSRRGVCNDFKEIFSRHEIRQAVKDANLNSLELEVFLTSLCSYRGWQESIAAKYINERTGKRLTRQYVSIVKTRAEQKVKSAYLNPPKQHLENKQVDEWFDEMNGNFTV